MTALDANQLASAFRRCQSPRYTAFDAKNIARIAFGVIASGLTAEEASNLTRALTEVGIAVERVPESLLQLPSPVSLSQVELRPDAITHRDGSGQEQRIVWEEVRVVALATFRKEAVVQTRAERDVYVGGYRAHLDAEYRLRESGIVVVDFVAEHPTRHFRSHAESHGSEENLRGFLGELLLGARAAIISAGTAEYVAGGDLVPHFPEEKFFHRHLSWLYWRQSERLIAGASAETLAKTAAIAPDSLLAEAARHPVRRFERKLELPGSNLRRADRPLSPVRGVPVEDLGDAMARVRDDPGELPIDESTPVDIADYVRRGREWEQRRMANAQLAFGALCLIGFGALLIAALTGRINPAMFRLGILAGGLLAMMAYSTRKYWF